MPGVCNICHEYHADLVYHRRFHQNKCKIKIPGASASQDIYRNEQSKCFHCPACNASYRVAPVIQAHVRKTCKAFFRLEASDNEDDSDSSYNPYRRKRAKNERRGHHPKHKRRGVALAQHVPVVTTPDHEMADEERNGAKARTDEMHENSRMGPAAHFDAPNEESLRDAEQASAPHQAFLPSPELTERGRSPKVSPVPSLQWPESRDDNLNDLPPSLAYRPSSRVVDVSDREQPNSSLPLGAPPKSPAMAKQRLELPRNLAASPRISGIVEHNRREGTTSRPDRCENLPQRDEVSAISSFLAKLTRNLANELSLAFEAFGCKTAEDLDALCLMDPVDDWAVLRDYLAQDHKVELLRWLIIKTGLEARRASLPSQFPPVPSDTGITGANDAVSMWLGGLKRPLCQHISLFHKCGLRDLADLDVLCMLEEHWDAVKDEMSRNSLSMLEWLVVKDGLKTRLSSMQSRAQ